MKALVSVLAAQGFITHLCVMKPGLKGQLKYHNTHSGP